MRSGITAHRLKALGLVDKIRTSLWAAHTDHKQMAAFLKRADRCPATAG